MKINLIIEDNIEIAQIESNEILISDVQSALDLMATVRYQTGSDHMIIDKSSINEAFFDLKTGLAGEVLQKYINYKMKIAIYGDFSMYSSKSLKDFIYESNNGRDVFFVNSIQEAINKLKLK